LNLRGRKTGSLLVVLLTGACLSTRSRCAAQTPTPETAKKPVAQKSTGATTPAPTHPTTNPPVTHRTATAARDKPATHRATAASTAKKPAARPTATTAARRRATAATPARKTSTVHRTRGRRRRRRPLSGRQRLARLHLEPGRVTEIQQALMREGYLQGDANGRWDDRTRAAMLHYQTDHGFPATGLPEAKSLMKLGLGPHPLPPQLDTGQARATAPDAKGAPPAEPPVAPASQEATPPEEK
jgi:hypothetical protein